MTYLLPIAASVATALLLLAGFVALDARPEPWSPSVGAALALGAVAAFFLTYDMLARRAGFAPRPRTGLGRGKPVTPTIDPHDILLVNAAPRDKDQVRYIDNVTKGIGKDRAAVLRIVVKAGARYERDHLRYQIHALFNRCPRHPVVYFVEPQDQFLAVAAAPALVKLLDTREGNGFIELINNGIVEQLLTEKVLERERLSSTLSDAEALSELARMGTNRAMIVRQGSERPVGLVEWSTLVERVVKLDKRDKAA